MCRCDDESSEAETDCDLCDVPNYVETLLDQSNAMPARDVNYCPQCGTEL